MKPNDRERDDALDRYWDATQRGERPPRPAAVDPFAAAVVAHLAERRTPPHLEATHRRVRLRLIDSTSAMEDTMDATALPRAGIGPIPSSTASRGQVDHVRTRRSGFALLTTAALLLLTIGLGAIAFGPGRAGDDRPATLLAPVAATPALDPTDETLLRIPLSAETPPHGDRITGSLHDVTMPAGATAAWTADQGACCPGARLDYVRVGQITARADGPVEVWRGDGGGSPESVPAGTDIVLAVSDAMLFPNGTGVSYSTPDATPVELLTSVLYDGQAGGYEEAPLPDGWIQRHAAALFDKSLPAGPSMLGLRRVVLTPDATMPPPPAALQLGVLTPELAAGTPAPRDLTVLDDGTLRNFGDGAVVVYILTLEPAGGGGTTPAAGSPTP